MSSEALSSKLQEVQGYLDAERSSRTDLEMFVAVLNTQKGNSNSDMYFLIQLSKLLVLFCLGWELLLILDYPSSAGIGF